MAFAPSIVMKVLRGHHSQALLLTLVLTCFPYANATTQWALSDGATIISQSTVNTEFTPDVQIVKAQAFKSFYVTELTTLPLDRQIMMDLGASETVETVHVMNFIYD